MDKGEGPYRSHLFTVRLWQEELGAGQSEWRGKVQHVLSGQTGYFRDWSMLVTYLQTMLPAADSDQQAGGGESAVTGDR